jgi:hypothetical protein
MMWKDLFCDDNHDDDWIFGAAKRRSMLLPNGRYFIRLLIIPSKLSNVSNNEVHFTSYSGFCFDTQP